MDMENIQYQSSSSTMEPNMRLKILTQFGNSVDIDPRVPPRRYYRSGLEMVRMANSYYEEGSLENAFILYMKFVVLFLEKIRSHPDLPSVSIIDRQVNAQKLREVLPRAEELKQLLLEKYNQDYQQQLVFQMEQLKTRETEESKKRAKEVADNAKMQLGIRDEKPAQEPWRTAMVPAEKYLIMPPELPHANELYPDPDANVLPAKVKSPKMKEQNRSPLPIPDRNLKPVKLELPVAAGTEPRPSVDRSTKPLSLLSPSLHSRLGLRRVIVPSNLMQKFMSLAQRNTDKNIETCGILAGTLIHDQLIVTHLLVPNQHGTSDSCATENEEEVFAFQDRHDLITFGWIHTHPSQTAFLSSVDLHTHFSYQMLMPEAIAIVCAPRYKETGIYMLTPNHGLDFISKCDEAGFHPHPAEPPLFMEAQHAVIDDTALVKVVDLRR